MYFKSYFLTFSKRILLTIYHIDIYYYDIWKDCRDSYPNDETS